MPMPSDSGHRSSPHNTPFSDAAPQGVIPQEVCLGLTTLQSLDLGQNRLVDEIPAELCTSMGQLEFLRLNNNRLEGDLVSARGALKSVDHRLLRRPGLLGQPFGGHATVPRESKNSHLPTHSHLRCTFLLN